MGGSVHGVKMMVIACVGYLFGNVSGVRLTPSFPSVKQNSRKLRGEIVQSLADGGGRGEQTCWWQLRWGGLGTTEETIKTVGSR